ncbi:YsnF/AvaK domain-containing protein [Corynebacterium pseudokroppenstedtii]|uniref:YsnF/AvaK domain-containing protein n=1 Tax=Corynebacterium pseudokroppenstedtii TaxID=2804917 RepID=A0AAU0PZ37_9CORY|nr:YsnF/AvaK domain-containing protein [Corynebacterium pseudokroppenstedtii]MDU6478494.1 YsnF/AvaK domain-containing protein [Corynebacterium kroppenstedtii]MBY0791470.1 YsnF/AvaK domain-containing protein [Corynebacterium pseudokroppenstedtii]MCF6793994.1 YsnF/AvaK domain-containing protein [Corynebacterium pseudokroppenstedtii]MCF8703484.1 YsnF/AvaK domain-containing protein [Corynebacterium pseudokroppenstedtii]MCG2636982.1 YsnF/AvaK domain-containing protein [Corynebacterium pseudokroppen
MADQKFIQAVLESTAFDKNGDKVGKVGQLFVDSNSGEPTFVAVNTGLFGRNSSLVPLAGAKLNNEELHVAHTKDEISDAPNISDTDEGLEPEEEERLYKHYGLTTQDSAQTQASDRGNAAQAGTAAGTGAAAGTAAGTTGRREETAKTSADTGKKPATSGDGSVIRSEEQLNVNKEKVASGRARLRKYVVEDTETVEVPVSREEVKVEREKLSPEEAKKLGNTRIGEENADVVLHEEQVNVDKETVPVEKVNLNKETVTEKQKVSEDLKKERVEFQDDTKDGKK